MPFKNGAAVTFGLESANVVGYQNIDVVGGGFNYLTPTFLPVNGGDIDLQDIKLDPNTATEYGDNIQIWDEGGALLSNYIYVGGAWSEDWATPVEGVTIKAGSSFVIEATADTKVTFSGAVATADTTVEGVSGFNMVGNASPVDIDIQSIKLGEGATEYGDNIQIWDNGGALIANYIYVGGAWSEDWATPVENVTIKAGQGFTIEITNPGTEIILPPALKK